MSFVKKVCFLKIISIVLIYSLIDLSWGMDLDGREVEVRPYAYAHNAVIDCGSYDYDLIKISNPQQKESHVWTLKQRKGGEFVIFSKATERFLAVSESKDSDVRKRTKESQWTIEKIETLQNKSFYRIISVKTGKALSYNNAGPEVVMQPVSTRTGNNYNSQLWEFRKPEKMKDEL